MGGMHNADTRWDNYRFANSMRPSARERELSALFKLLDPKPGERIWEVGTGSGYLTFPIAQAVAPGGLVVTSDVEEGNIEEVERKNEVRNLPIETRLLQKGDVTFADANNFDAVTSIATFHHYDDRIQKSGERGRRSALDAFFKA
jgi:cyclopropane fatty-acyl-phospholipid synthase-like methyltransferase